MKTSHHEIDTAPHQHRYHAEWNIEQIANQLVKRLTLLESRNAALCDKLGLPKRELATLDQQVARTLFGTETDECAEQPYPRFY